MRARADLELEAETPENQALIDRYNEISEDLKDLKDTLSIIVDQTSPPTLFQRIQENIMDYIITLGIGLAIGYLIG